MSAHGTATLPHVAALTVLMTAATRGAVADIKVWDPQPGSSSWSNPQNWSPTGAPQDGDVAQILVPQTVYVDQTTEQIEWIEIAGGAHVRTNGNLLYVSSGSNSISTVSGAGTRLAVDASTSSDLVIESLQLFGGGRLQMAGGSAYAYGDLTIFDGQLDGYGSLDLTGDLSNAGHIEAAQGTLTLRSDGGTIDLDGNTGLGSVRVGPNATLVVDGGFPGLFDGPMELGFGSTLRMEQEWSYDGAFGDLVVAAGSGEARIEGPAFNNADRIVVETGRLRIASEQFWNDPGSTIDVSGSLLVDGEFVNTGALILGGGIAVAPDFDNRGMVLGVGLVEAEELDNNGTIEAEGGPLAFVVGALPDYDGSEGSGRIDAIDGDVSFFTTSTSLHGFSGTMLVGPGHTVDFGTSGISINDATVESYGGTIRAGRIRVPNVGSAPYRALGEAASTLATTEGVTIWGDMFVEEELHVAGPMSISIGANLTGDGLLVIRFDGVLDVIDGADVDLRTRIEGQLDPGSDERATVYFDRNLVFSGGALTRIDLTPAGPDFIEIADEMQLGGTLRVDVADGFQPAAGDMWTFMSAGSRTGTFDEYDLPAGLHAELGTGEARIYAWPECSGDIVPDGVLDVDDLVLLLTNWGASGHVADVDHDGTVGANDLITILGNWGACP